MRRFSGLQGANLATHLCVMVLLATAGCMGTQSGGGPAAADAADPATVAEICAAVPCRPAGEFQLKGPDGHLQRFQIAESPYVDNGVVSILPGESFYVTGRIQDGRLTDLRYSDVAPRGGNALSFKFEQTEHGMNLAIMNWFKETVKYRAAMRTDRGPEFYKTSICPVSPDATMYEIWPQPLTLILMRDFQTIPADGPRVCD